MPRPSAINPPRLLFPDLAGFIEEYEHSIASMRALIVRLATRRSRPTVSFMVAWSGGFLPRWRRAVRQRR